VNAEPRPASPRTWKVPPAVVFLVNCVTFVVFLGDAIYDPTLTIAGYVVLSLLMLWSLLVAVMAALEAEGE